MDCVPWALHKVDQALLTQTNLLNTGEQQIPQGNNKTPFMNMHTKKDKRTQQVSKDLTFLLQAQRCANTTNIIKTLL